MRATLKDIAKRTGLSISGVSRALQDHPDISPETKAKVRAVAQELHYHPNPNARLLREQKSGMVALILPEVNTFFFPEMLEGISKVIEKNGYSLLFLQSDNSFNKEKQLVEYCLQMFVEGVIISLAVETNTLEHLQALRKNGATILLTDRVIHNSEFPCLSINDEAAGFQAADYLWKKGHRHILGVFDDQRLEMSIRRAEGFRRALRERGCPPHNIQCIFCRYDQDVEHLVTCHLENHPNTSAVFTMSDKLMAKTFHAIHTSGFKIPEDISLFSISDGKAPQYLYPGISHLRHSGQLTGSMAAECLIHLMHNSKSNLVIPEVPLSLVELGSVI